jgi:hypothetical protein
VARSHCGVDASRLKAPMRIAVALLLATTALGALAGAPQDRPIAVAEEPPDLPRPLPLLLQPGTPGGPRHPEARAGRVYPRGLRLDRYAMRMRHQGREPDLSALPPLVTSPAIIVAWDYVPLEPPPGAACGFAAGAPSRVDIEIAADGHPATPPAIQPLTVIFDRARIRELLAPFETDVARVRFLAVLDPARLRAPSALFWRTSVPCRQEPGPVETWAYIDADDIARWLAPSRPAPSR